MTSFHETYAGHDAAKASSPRTFGLVIGALLVLLALRSYTRHGRLWPWLLGAGTVLILLGAVRPSVLAPLAHAWMALGTVLNRIVSPIALALLFFGVVWPVGRLMRLAGSDTLRLKKPTGEKDSCWVDREPLVSDHFTRQF